MWRFYLCNEFWVQHPSQRLWVIGVESVSPATAGVLDWTNVPRKEMAVTLSASLSYPSWWWATFRSICCLQVLAKHLFGEAKLCIWCFLDSAMNGREFHLQWLYDPVGLPFRSGFLCPLCLCLQLHQANHTASSCLRVMKESPQRRHARSSQTPNRSGLGDVNSWELRSTTIL